MIDPLSNMIEVMNSLPKNQHIWFQIIIISEKEPNWHPASEAYIQSIIDKHMGKKDNSAKSPFLNIFKEISLAIGNAFAGLLGGELSKSSSEEENNGGNNKDGEFNAQKLPPGEQEKIKAIYDNLSKPSFLTVIRFIYFGTKDGYNKALGVAGLMGMTKQLSDVNLNALIPSYRTKTFANYYFDQERLLYRKRKIVADYRGRSISGMYQIMNTEELATIFHFPDLAVKNLERAQSKKEDAPVDLPTTDTNSTIVQENLANLSRERDNIGNLDTENKIVDKDKIFKNIGIASISTNNHSHSAEDLKENLSELPQPFSVNKKIDDNIENFEKQQTDSSEDVIEEYIEPTEEYIEPTEEYVEPTEENFNNDRDMTIKEQITANNVKSQNKISKSYEVNCSACGVITTVNFKPDSIRPVFCANCLREHRRTQSKLKEVQRQGKEDSNNKVKNKQESFSKNISPQKSKIIITKNKKTVKSKNEIDSSAVQKIIQDAMIDK
jgi:CxxC-x17-CxxC domain-containing protein